jgi:hypothetical protein
MLESLVRLRPRASATPSGEHNAPLLLESLAKPVSPGSHEPTLFLPTVSLMVQTGPDRAGPSSFRSSVGHVRNDARGRAATRLCLAWMTRYVARLGPTAFALTGIAIISAGTRVFAAAPTDDHGQALASRARGLYVLPPSG